MTCQKLAIFAVETSSEGKGPSSGNDHVLVVFRCGGAIGAGHLSIRGAADAVVNADDGRCRSRNRRDLARARVGA